jgi:hypothetical protein
VQRVNGGHRKAVEQPILDHHLRTGVAFLSRLEDRENGAVELPIRGEATDGAEQHRRMTVMPAGMHASVVSRPVRDIVAFTDRQCVHVSAKTDRTTCRVLPSMYDGDDTASPDSGVNFISAGGRQFGRNQLRRSGSMQPDFRVRV